jgi:putative tryptophan/tyrosine transport system substrate-binding protein
MRRREFMMLAGGAGVAWSVDARAQQAAMPIVGFLHSASPGPLAHEAATFSAGLKEAGFTEGQNVTIEYRWAEGRSERLPALAADLAQRQVAVIAALGGDATVLAARAATASIPIVFLNGSDPVKSGLVASLNRPEGNVTGVSLFAGTVDAKRLELMHELVPQVGLIAVLNNSLVAEAEARSKNLQQAARDLGLRMFFQNISRAEEFETAFAAISEQKAGGLFVDGSPYFLIRREQLTALAARHALPATYAWQEFATAGGLMSYGTSLTNAARQAGIYTGRILKGAKPSELPVMQPTKFDLVINIKTAKALGLTVPDKLIALADEVIE